MAALLLFASSVAFAISTARAADSTAVPPPQVSPPAPTTPAPTPEPAPQVATPAPATAAAAAAPADAVPEPPGWPRLIETAAGSKIIIYQPQVLSWDRQRDLKAMAAISHQAKGATKPSLGTLTLESPTSVAMDERMVKLEKIRITEMKFPSLEKAQAQEALAEIQKTVPDNAVFMDLDRILAAVDKSQIRGSSIQVSTNPPPIFYSEKPAILVQFDGPAIMSGIDGTTLKYVLNTNWDVLQDVGGTNLYYLRDGSTWMQTADLKGEWEPVKKLPETFAKLPATDNWSKVKDNVPVKKLDKGKMPKVIVTERPAELILLKGKPKYEKIDKKSKDATLLWVTNTESDLFRIKDKDFYFLVAGRWFSAPDPDGPWKFASGSLSPEFATIPADHPRARVRSSVPGTDEAIEAVLLASVPQTATVDAKQLKPPDVVYSGDPEFKAIEGSKGVSYAVNTSSDVLKVSDSYYLCAQGVWFVSKNPKGPWVVTTAVPPAIYDMPASSPMHHVTYVTVVDDDPDYPTYATTAGYTGVTIAFGCAMWGTGYYYPPYYHYPPHGYPIYHPYPITYGSGAMYNPATGRYGSYQAAYGPYGGVAHASTYNPRTGTYARGSMAWGPTGAQGGAVAYNPRTGTSAATRQGSNVYGSWGTSAVKRGDDWARTARVTDSQGNTKWAAQGSGGGSAVGGRGDQGSGFIGQSGSGDIYAGRDGNVYRKTDDGWQSHNNGEWSDVGGSGSRPGEGGAGTRPSQQPSGGAGAGTRPSTQPAGGAGAGAGTRPSTQPAGGAATRPAQQPSSATMGHLNNDAAGRQRGAQQSNSYSGGGRSGSASRGGGGMRGGGGRRR